MYESEKRLQKNDREKKILRLVDGFIIVLCLAVYYGSSVVMASFLYAFVPSYLLSVMASFFIVGFSGLVMMRLYMPDQFRRLSYFLFYESFRRGLIEFASDQTEDVAVNEI